MIDRNDLEGHVHSLHRYATGLTGNPCDAEDIVQECLRRVLDRIDKETPIQNLRAYLFQTLRNVHIDHCRRTTARRDDLNSEETTHSALSSLPNQEDRIRCTDIMGALDQIPESQREIVLLVCLEGMSYEQVAELTGTPIGTVRSRLHRGRAALSALIDPESDSAETEADRSHLAMIREARRD